MDARYKGRLRTSRLGWDREPLLRSESPLLLVLVLTRIKKARLCHDHSFGILFRFPKSFFTVKNQFSRSNKYTACTQWSTTD